MNTRIDMADYNMNNLGCHACGGMNLEPQIQFHSITWNKYHVATLAINMNVQFWIRFKKQIQYIEIVIRRHDLYQRVHYNRRN